MSSRSRKPNVVQDDADPMPIDVLASEIAAISAGVKRLRAGRLNDRALVLLIQHVAGVGVVTREQVRAVLDGIENLEREYLKP